MKSNLYTMISSSVLVLLILLAGCGEDGGGAGGDAGANAGGGAGGDAGANAGGGQGVAAKGENYLQMDADLTDAVSLTSTLPLDDKEDRHLLRVTSDNKFHEVFSGKYKLFSYKLTPTHIIAHVNIWEDKKHCSLIAIPKIQGKTPVLCLNRELLHCRSDKESMGQFGYDTRGSEVYFSFFEQVKKDTYDNRLNCSTYEPAGDSWTAINELRYWDGKSEKVTTLFHTKPTPVSYGQVMVKDVFASQTTQAVCIDTFNTGNESLFCRSAGETKWKRRSDIQPDYSRALRLKSFLLGKSTKLNLDTFEVTARTGGLPYGIHFQLENGGSLGQDSKRILLVQPDGNSKEILNLENSGRTPARLGNWAWYASGESLKRVNLTDGTLEEKEYFPTTTLLRLSAIFWTLGDFLRVDGLGTSGMPEKSFLNQKGELVYVDATPIQVEHPIDLKWEK